MAAGIQFVDMDGNLVDLNVWARKYDLFVNRTLACTDLDGRRLITVLTGICEPGIGNYPFGTALIVAGEITELAQYRSREAAEAGHQAILAWLSEHPDERFTEAVRERLLPDSEPAL